MSKPIKFSPKYKIIVEIIAIDHRGLGNNCTTKKELHGYGNNEDSAVGLLTLCDSNANIEIRQRMDVNMSILHTVHLKRLRWSGEYCRIDDNR